MEESRNRKCPSTSPKYKTAFSLNVDRPLEESTVTFFPLVFWVHIVENNPLLSHMFVLFKNGSFVLRFRRELQREMCPFFLLLTFMHPTSQQFKYSSFQMSPKNQITCDIPCRVTRILLNQHFDLVVINDHMLA